MSSRELAATLLPLTLSHIQTLGFSVNLQKSSIDLGSTVFFAQVGNMLCFEPSTSVRAPGGCVSLHCLAQFLDDFTADRHDGFYDRCSAALAVKDESV